MSTHTVNMELDSIKERNMQDVRVSSIANKAEESELILFLLMCAFCMGVGIIIGMSVGH